MNKEYTQQGFTAMILDSFGKEQHASNQIYGGGCLLFRESPFAFGEEREDLWRYMAGSRKYHVTRLC